MGELERPCAEHTREARRVYKDDLQGEVLLVLGMEAYKFVQEPFLKRDRVTKKRSSHPVTPEVAEVPCVTNCTKKSLSIGQARGRKRALPSGAFRL